MNENISEKMRANAHKIGFYMQQYPDKKLNDVLGLLQFEAIHINSALWAAQALGLISEPDKTTGELHFLAEPENGWDFGADVDNLEKALVFCFGTLATREEDLEEYFISQWTTGLPAIDVLVAVRHLLETKKLVEYELQDQRRDEKGNKVFEEDENTPIMETYIFYTLFENASKEWGRKQFKEELPASAKEESEA